MGQRSLAYRYRRTFSVILTCAVLSACSRQQPQELGIGTSSLTPLHAALGEILEHTDILERRGLRGRFLEFERGRDQHEQAVRGEVDATFSCEVPAMVHLQRLEGTVLTGSPGELGRMALVVPAWSSARDVAGLPAGDLAVLGGASADMVMTEWIEDAGRQGEFRLVKQGGRGQETVQALLSGQVVGAVLWDPWLALAVEEHGFRVLREAPFWSVVMTWPERAGDRTWDAWHLALQDAMAWAAANPDRAVAMAAGRSGLSEEIVRKVLSANRYVAGEEPPSLEAGEEVRRRLADCEAWARRTGEVPPDFELEPRLRLGRRPPASEGE